MNYYIKPWDDLVAIAKEKGIKEESIAKSDDLNSDRRDLARVLTQLAAEEGKLDEAVIIDDETNEVMPELSAKKDTTDPKYKNGWVDIVFHNQEGATKYVYLGLNGQSMYLPREVPIRIPAEYMSVLRSAVQIKMTQDLSDGKVRMKSVRVPRFSYEILKQGN